jgi:LysM repeat protein
VNRRAISTGALVVLCLLSALLVSCAVELTDDSASPTAAATVNITPVRTPTSSFTPTVPSEPTATPTEPLPDESEYATHTVQAGDTLLGLARQYGVPMAAIQLENDMGGSTILPTGQRLSIPPRTGWEGASAFWIVHRVKAGDTLIGIARTYDVEIQEIQTVNGLTDADQIRVEQDLIIPLESWYEP